MRGSKKTTHMASPDRNGTLHLALPKGRTEAAILRLLEDAGIHVTCGARAYRPAISLPGYEVKLLKPQSIVEMLAQGSRDLGFCGLDWVLEKEAELVELLDTRLDPVRLVAAAPPALMVENDFPRRELTVATEYERLAREWVRARGLSARVVRSHGATEVLPPEDADVVVDNTSTGQTLASNGLVEVDELLCSSTRLYAHPRSLEDAAKRRAIDGFVLLLRSVLDARERVLVEVNVAHGDLPGLIEILPCMRRPTIATLHGEDGYAVKAAVPRKLLPELIPALKARGATDIVVCGVDQLVP